MAQICEICGADIRGDLRAFEIDGVTLMVCPSCSRLGKPAKEKTSTSDQPIRNPSIVVRSPPRVPTRPRIIASEPILELRPDFAQVIRAAREQKSISQEDLARKMNEKVSVIKHLEVGKLRPDDILGRKIENILKVDLYVPPEDIE